MSVSVAHSQIPAATTDMGLLAHRNVCLFTPQLSPVPIYTTVLAGRNLPEKVEEEHKGKMANPH